MKMISKILFVSIIGVFHMHYGATDTKELFSNVNTYVDEEFVSRVVGDISCDDVVNALLIDLQTIFQLCIPFMNQFYGNYASSIGQDVLIAQYKKALAGFYMINQMTVLSDYWKEKIAWGLISFIDSMIFSNNGNVGMQELQNVIILFDMLGVSFTCKSYFEDILNAVNKQCAFLKNSDINDICFERTVSRIYEELGKKIVKTNLFERCAMLIMSLSMQIFKDQINMPKQIKEKNKKKVTIKKNNIL